MKANSLLLILALAVATAVAQDGGMGPGPGFKYDSGSETKLAGSILSKSTQWTQCVRERFRPWPNSCAMSRTIPMSA